MTVVNHCFASNLHFVDYILISVCYTNCTKRMVTAIIPAYNEEHRIASVISAAKLSRYLDEIIVVDDGSSDRTKEVSKMFSRVLVVSLPKNRGKSYAVKKGVKVAKKENEFILLLDADLLNLSQDHIDRLIEPVISGCVDSTLSSRGYACFHEKYITFSDPFINGQRCLKKKHLQAVFDELVFTRYQIEMAINKYLLDHKLSMKILNLDKLGHALKKDKEGFFTGCIQEIKMGMADINRFGFREVFRQVLRISVKYRLRWLLT